MIEKHSTLSNNPFIINISYIIGTISICMLLILNLNDEVFLIFATCRKILVSRLTTNLASDAQSNLRHGHQPTNIPKMCIDPHLQEIEHWD